MSQPRPRARGFTLAEILVAVVIIALVAAVLTPTIVGQLNKADPQAIGSSADAIRSAVLQFSTDTRRFPRYISQLVTRPVSTDSALFGGKFADNEILSWNGPYLAKDATAALQSGGWGLSWDPRFRSSFVGTSGLVQDSTVNPRSITLNIAMDSSQAVMVDALFDDRSFLTGIMRWTANVAGTTDTLKVFLTMTGIP